jgi:signal transduction histidine kinase
MRTRLLLSLLSLTIGLTGISLLIVRRGVQRQATKQTVAQLRDSLLTFQNFQRERELTLDHSAMLLADLPDLRALMTTRHPATIQDASQGLWKLAGSDLFLLADPDGKIVALHTSAPGFTPEMAQQTLSLSVDRQQQWWFGGQRLYEVFVRPIYFGPASANRVLGYLVVGYEINDAVASQISHVAGGEVAFYSGSDIVKSTLPPAEEAELALNREVEGSARQPVEIRLGQERFLVSSTDLSRHKEVPIRLTVLKSYDQAIAVLTGLNQLLTALGIVALTIGGALGVLISETFTRPLAKLVEGVRALGKGDFSYPLEVRGSDEVAEVTASFKAMRDNLLRAQEKLLEAERLATIGRMASSISHDLRHSLAAIVANAEFLCEARLSSDQREELYGEVRVAVNQMTDLIDSLLEFSRPRESLRPLYARVRDTVDRAVQAVRAHPEFHRVRIMVREDGHAEGWFDPRKLQRAVSNLVLNACESVTAESGEVAVHLREVTGGAEIRIADNGRGIPGEVRDTLFDPFVSWGKENGTGLGLTVVQKIISDHGGEVAVENTSSSGTVFKLWLPLPLALDSKNDGVGEEKSPSAPTATQ